MEEVVSVRSADTDADQDLHAALIGMIAAVSEDGAQLRMLVYEFARRKLRRNLYQKFEDGDWSGIQERTRALEAAIEKIESEVSQSTVTFDAEPPLTYPEAIFNFRPTSQTAVTVASPSAPAQSLYSLLYEIRRLSQLQTISDDSYQIISDDKYSVVAPERRSRPNFWWRVQLATALLLGVVLYAAIDGASVLGLLKPHKLDAPGQIAAADARNAGGKRISTIQSASPDIPTPSDYGVYALSNGKLTELEPLSMRVPDPRVAISPIITTPSPTHLPPGALQFVAFRRDLMNNAPDRVSVRVVAQVKRALTFDAAGKAAVTPVNDAWVVRSNSYQMKVAPVPDNPEMVIIRPDHPGIDLPAGRYALVLKSVAYDFTIDGPQTDAAHCLERTDALNAPVYTECRNL